MEQEFSKSVKEDKETELTHRLDTISDRLY